MISPTHHTCLVFGAFSYIHGITTGYEVEICRRMTKQLSMKLYSTVLVARNGINSSDIPALSKCKDFLTVNFIKHIR